MTQAARNQAVATTDLDAQIARYCDLFQQLPPVYQQTRIQTVWAHAEAVADDPILRGAIEELATHLEEIAA